MEPKDEAIHYVVFRVDRQGYALPLENVRRALRMVALTPLPDAPAWVIGAINMASQMIPVLDLRQRFGRVSRKPDIDDRLLIIQHQQQTAALIVDEVVDVLELQPQQIETPSTTLSHSRFLEATIHHTGNLVMVLNMGRLLSTGAQKRTHDHGSRT
jgi:purine-binding chemotaxis protein CheW